MGLNKIMATKNTNRKQSMMKRTTYWVQLQAMMLLTVLNIWLNTWVAGFSAKQCIDTWHRFWKVVGGTLWASAQAWGLRYKPPAHQAVRAACIRSSASGAWGRRDRRILVVYFVELRCGKVAEKVDCLLMERQYTSLGNKLAVRRKRSASAVITQGAVNTPLPGELNWCEACSFLMPRSSRQRNPFLALASKRPTAGDMTRAKKQNLAIASALAINICLRCQTFSSYRLFRPSVLSLLFSNYHTFYPSVRDKSTLQYKMGDITHPTIIGKSHSSI